MKVKLGQNFLTDENIAKREVKYAKLNNEDSVLEIGPGKGFLTKFISKEVKKVTAIEYDKKLYDYLKKNVANNVDLINGDAVDIDFNKINFNKILANLPFQISSPITFKILKYNFDCAVLIYQLDFAKRMVALPGSKDYSHLTVHLYYKAFCELLEIVSSKLFNPEPKVDAAIVKIIPIKRPPFEVKNENLFFNLSRLLFNYRRKMIKNILKNNFKNLYLNNLPFLDKRVEELSPEQIGLLSDIISEEV